MSLADRQKAADGKWRGSIRVAWEGSHPMIEVGTPHPWMLQEPVWERAIRQYVEKCRAQQFALHGGIETGKALGEGEKTLPPPAKLAELVQAVRKPALDRYLECLRAAGPMTDKEVAEQSGVPLVSGRPILSHRVRGS
jgi:hypothetical protein